MRRKAQIADVCLLLEGTYPYVAGGVSSWVHDLIRAQRHLGFALVSLVPGGRPQPSYALPGNVVSHVTVAVTEFPGEPGAPMGEAPARDLMTAATPFLLGGTAGDLAALCAIARRWKRASARSILDTKAAFEQIVALHEAAMRDASFLDFFWSWRGLALGLFAVLLAPLPPARVYHAISTGYAGLMAARARLETGRPVLLTEHGIYTNERRIEIALADWLHDEKRARVGLLPERGLRDLWSGAFAAYSRAAYTAARRIVTLYRGNQAMQIADGAPREKLMVIPNGVEFARFARIPRKSGGRPSVALIGRVTPIKDVKTYLRAFKLVREALPAAQGYVIGPMDEDADYARDCRALAQELGLAQSMLFTGRANLADVLPQIDVNVLTSVSEAQPLVVLEAGAAGIPTVATDVGSCRELILGTADEHPKFGPGGAVTPLADPRATADAILTLLVNPGLRARAGSAMQQRVSRFYTKERMDRAYAALYGEAIVAPGDAAAAPMRKAV